MVMEAQPSPQSVGREFVRQYYTLLNKAPNHLHRFYNNHSSFIHDGLDINNREASLVIGQKNIHNRIQQLNFSDCHAKISQVDAQATLGNGVVVQVTGELSNDGQPMRRFTQTFVLGAQSPKNYYVHNDIFRYQDLYTDDENDVESRSENDEEHEAIDGANAAKLVDASTNQLVSAGQQQQQQSLPNPQQQQQIYYSMPQNVVSAPAAPRAVPVVTPTAGIAGVGQNVPITGFSNASVVAPLSGAVQQQPQLNGIAHEDLMQQQLQGPPPSAVQNVQTPSVVPQPQLVQPIAVTPSAPVVPVQTPILPPQPIINQAPLDAGIINDGKDLSESPIADIKDDFNKISDQISEKLESTKIAPEPKTYANLFKSANAPSTGSGFVPLPPASNQTSSYKSEQRTQSSNQSAGLPQRTNSSRLNKDFPERRTSNSYGDSHQLFLGNVPHHATEDELRVLFGKFGTVIDLRIHSKAGAKMSGVRNPQNYGFITYDDPESVQNCLANCPLYFPENSPDGQQLNVEEKRARMRNSNDIMRSNPMSSNSGGLGGHQSGRQPNRSLPNTGSGMMRGSGGNGLIRGSNGGPRPNGGFNRNDNRGPGGGGQQNRGGNGNSASTGGGNSYGRR